MNQQNKPELNDNLHYSLKNIIRIIKPKTENSTLLATLLPTLLKNQTVDKRGKKNGKTRQQKLFSKFISGKPVAKFIKDSTFFKTTRKVKVYTKKVRTND